MNQTTENTDVLIVGAGPTGLMLACQLAIHRISFRIIDGNNSPSSNSGALIVQGRSLEIFRQMGIASEALENGIIGDHVKIIYNGKTIAGTTIRNIGGNLSPFPFLLMLEQSKTGEILTRFLNNQSFNVERGVSLKSFHQDNEKIVSQITLPDGSGQQIISRYLIGADGARSLVRKILKIDFKGVTYLKPIFIMDCEASTDLLPGEICFAFTGSSVAGFFPLKNSRWRIDGTLPANISKLDTITIESIQKEFPRWINVEFSPEHVEWFSVSQSHQKYARMMQTGNCFLAGDAAHINSPVGAQGMNTGLQDAYNLAWKIAFVIKHKAKQELLSTYDAERSGITRDFARYADTVFQLITNQSIGMKVLRSMIMKLFFRILFPFLVKRDFLRLMFYKSISQIGINYRKSNLSLKASDGRFLKSAPMPGDRMPVVEYINMGKKTDTCEMLDKIRFTLLVLSDNLPVEFKSLAEEFDISIELIMNSPECRSVFDVLGIEDKGFFLIRPDMYIAFRAANMKSDFLKNYLNRFLYSNTSQLI